MTTMYARVKRLASFATWSQISRELKLFGMASLLLGMSSSMIDSTFNNFLNDRFHMTGFMRSFLEFPRELPGFLVVFVSALLSFLCSRRLGALSLLFSVVGALLIGYLSPTYTIMVFWLFLYSLGQHLFMPVASTIGMELAHEGKIGQRLGQLNAIRNIAVILGGIIVGVGFGFLDFTYSHVFTIAAVGFALASLFMFAMKKGRPQPSGTFLKLRKEYNMFYILVVLSGSRKQLFITFAPWVLVTIFGQPPQIMATLLTIGAVIGILFQPLLGWTIDHFGEKIVLAAEAVLLVFVCFGYGFSRSVFSSDIAFYVVCACFLVDSMLVSVGMARSTYLRKIARDPNDIQPTLTTGVTIDHIFSISSAVLGGLIWNQFGFQYVFLFGTVIAILNFMVAMKLKLPSAAPAIAIEA